MRIFVFGLLLCLGAALVAPAISAPEKKGEQWNIGNLAGRYTTGEGGIRGVGHLLKLSSNGRYSIEATTCISKEIEERGTAVVTEDKLHLTSSGKDSTKTVLLPIVWGPRRYLVDEDQMLRFCNDVNLGIEPRKEDWGHTYLRLDDWNKKVDGKPKLQALWGDRLLDKPIEGKIMEVKADGQIVIDRGSDHRVFEKMTLVVIDADGYPHEVVVQSVDKTQCLAKPEREFKAKVGWTVSSRMPAGK